MPNPAGPPNEKSDIAVDECQHAQATSSNGYLSFVILTFNEELNLPDCLRSIRPLGCAVFIVDSGSVDRTKEIACEAGATFVHHRFENQAQQLNWALENLPLTSEWIMRLDADERLTPELARELVEGLRNLSEETSGLFVKRRVYFMRRWIKHGGYYPTWLLRVWRRGAAYSESRAMDEHMVLRRGTAGFLKHDILEENLKSLGQWIDRQNAYAAREVHVLLQKHRDTGIKPSLFGTPEARRRWLKYYAYLPFPPLFRAFIYFFWRYFLRLGFLDGKAGLIFHFLQGCWYRFLIDAKLYEHELERRVK